MVCFRKRAASALARISDSLTENKQKLSKHEHFDAGRERATTMVVMSIAVDFGMEEIEGASREELGQAGSC